MLLSQLVILRRNSAFLSTKQNSVTNGKSCPCAENMAFTTKNKLRNSIPLVNNEFSKIKLIKFHYRHTILFSLRQLIQINQRKDKIFINKLSRLAARLFTGFNGISISILTDRESWESLGEYENSSGQPQVHGCSLIIILVQYFKKTHLIYILIVKS